MYSFSQVSVFNQQSYHFIINILIFEDDSQSSPPFKGKMDTINVDKAVEFVLSCMNFDGGFGCRPGSESHAGQVSLLMYSQSLRKSAVGV